MLSLSVHKFNSKCVLETLRNLVLSEGGTIVSSFKHDDEVVEIKNRVDGSKRTVHGSPYGPSLYLSFVIDNIYYCIDINDNPFFGVKYQKYEIDGECEEGFYYLGSHYLNDFSWQHNSYSHYHDLFMSDDFCYTRSMNEQELLYISQELLNELKKSRRSSRVPIYKTSFNLNRNYRMISKNKNHDKNLRNILFVVSNERDVS